jgi:hypothetical protein
MSRINESHPEPVHHASVGHAHVKLLGANRAGDHPLHLDTPGAGDSAKLSRAQAKALTRQRKREVASGASFLEKLTTTKGRNG